MLTREELSLIEHALFRYSRSNFIPNIQGIMPKLQKLVDGYTIYKHFSNDFALLKAGMKYDPKLRDASIQSHVESTLQRELASSLSPYMFRCTERNFNCLGENDKTYEFASICVKLPKVEN